MRKILFVCSANKERSPTAADFFASKFPHHQFKSAGTNEKLCWKEGTDAITAELTHWADHIFVMETKHKKAIEGLGNKPSSQKLTVLHIPDHFNYYQKELLTLLEQKLLRFFES